jgi:hypothetical protein
MSPKLSARAEALIEQVFALAWEGPGVIAVLARQSDELDQWGRAFARTVRAHNKAALEIYMPSTREGLIDRFNQVLSGISLDAARAAAPDDLPRRIILVPDSRSFESPEGLLLARLVSDFPGAATRLVVLMDEEEGADRCERLLASLGRSARRIDLLGESVMAQSKVLARVERHSARPAEPLSPPAPESRPPPFVVDPERQVAMLPSADFSRPRRSSTMRWLGAGAVLMGLLLVSALIVVLLHRETGPGAAFDQRPALGSTPSPVAPVLPTGTRSNRPSQGA